ncbi:hypothetical protein [Streptomyces sp. NPDC006638]|uniref:hypothetical protein n=1 Tax=Streptomyces sp. NPDC006638 TaxID=3157183 RepID=UPI0033BD5175
MRPQTARVVAVVALLACGIAGCAPARSSGPADRRGAAALTDAAVDLAVQAEPFRRQQSLLRWAEEELTHRCMVDRGFPQPYGPTAHGRDDTAWRPDLDARRIRGYGFTEAAPTADDQYPAGLPVTQRARYARALTGDRDHRASLRLSSGPEFTFSASGCLAEGRAGLYGDVMAAAKVSYVPQEAHNAIYGRIAQDPVMARALARWASCMKRRGHPYPSMEAARAAARHGPGGTDDARADRQFEVRTAVADAECALAADVPGAAESAGRRHAVGLTSEQRRDLNSATDLRAAALVRARELEEEQR